MKKVLLLGATGSIGESTLRVIANNSSELKLSGVTCKKNIKKIKEISEKYNSPYLVTGEDIEKSSLSSFIDSVSPDIIVNGIASSDGLYASLLALEKKIDLALANKESIVLGGEIINNLSKKNNTKIIPLDSEHSSLYNLIKDDKENINKFIITASGGPLIDRKNLKDVKIKDVLKHPTWNMGKKISVDSASLCNKGFEVIEASLLFNIHPSKIEVIINRESILHSAILLNSGMIKGEISSPDMKLPISRALLGDGFSSKLNNLDFSSLTLHFEKPDYKKFPLLSLGYNVLYKNNGARCAYCVSDEGAVNAFLNGKISFLDIFDIVQKITNDEKYNITLNTYNEIKELKKEIIIKTAEYVKHC